MAAGQSALAVGDQVAGKYVVERAIGRGGMGAVFVARAIDSDERVAIKVLLSEYAGASDLVRRFFNEARAAAKIDSPHVVRVIETGETKARIPFIVLEYLDGLDLGALLVTDGRLPIARAVDYVMQTLEGLGPAHELGIVHRDLKPANLFLARLTSGEEVIKLLDFGISKLAEDGPNARAPLTATASAFGSPHYMSPEQIRSSKYVDARADIWSVGIVLFELTTGARAFAGANAGDTLTAVLTEPPRSLCAVLPDAPPALEAVIARCLERDLEKRYPDVLSLARALAPFTPRGPESLARVRASVKAARRARAREGGRLPALRLTVIAVAALTLLAIGGAAWWRSRVTASGITPAHAEPAAPPSSHPLP